jgi:hypothetical protein
VIKSSPISVGGATGAGRFSTVIPPVLRSGPVTRRSEPEMRRIKLPVLRVVCRACRASCFFSVWRISEI